MKKVFAYYLVLTIFLNGCAFQNLGNKKTPEIVLQKLGINGQSEYSLLSVCQQVETYSIVGAEFLDIDHTAVLVPNWMYKEISEHSTEAIVECIAEQGGDLVSKLSSAVTIENERASLRIHVLVYLSNDLGLLMSPKIEQFVLSAICNADFYARERIAILYYVADGQDVYNFSDPPEIINYYCK